jgi:hypothetical protein
MNDDEKILDLTFEKQKNKNLCKVYANELFF